jgi:hypothetical protein
VPLARLRDGVDPRFVEVLGEREGGREGEGRVENGEGHEVQEKEEGRERGQK